MIYLDFSKAFDKVPHKRLLHKIESHGISGNVAAWIGEWLCDRKQQVVLNGKFSRLQDVLSGVPQGSVLGPILFLIFVNLINLPKTSLQIVPDQIALYLVSDCSSMYPIGVRKSFPLKNLGFNLILVLQEFITIMLK